jgi:ferredoxin/flavodoxin---NADP+ reductase
VDFLFEMKKSNKNSKMNRNIQLFPVKVTKIRQEAAAVFVLSVEKKINFRAGQVVAIDLVKNGKPRMYSIASRENAAEIEILFDEKPDGCLTPKLSKLKPGDIVFCSEAFGNFLPTTDKAWFIAAGTGVAPFVSMLRSGYAAHKTLVHGGRFLQSFYFQDEISMALGDNYIRCCSQESSSDVYAGRLTQYLSNQNGLPQDVLFYLCGSPAMVVEVRDILIRKGVDFSKIVAETYF